MPDVLLATCAELPKGDEDAELLRSTLAGFNVAASWVAWTDRSVNWTCAPVVLRSTWDYTPRQREFLAWVGALTRVHNRAPLVRWNTDKTYLLDLDAAGVAITPTAIARPGETVHLPSTGEYVVKPSVGAGSRGAGRFTADRAEAAAEHVAGLHAAGRTVLIQPYLNGVDDHGETALIFLDGTFSHAVRKGPMLPSGVVHPIDGWQLYVEEQISSRVASASELAVGMAALTAIVDRFGAPPLYARVDLLPSVDGPVVVELELTEPSLFLQYGDGDAPVRRFAAAIAEIL